MTALQRVGWCNCVYIVISIRAVLINEQWLLQGRVHPFAAAPTLLLTIVRDTLLLSSV